MYLTWAPAAITVNVHEDGSHLPALRGPPDRAQPVGQWLALRGARGGSPAPLPLHPLRRRAARAAPRRQGAGLAAVAASGGLAGDRVRGGGRRPHRHPGLRGRADRAQPGRRPGGDAAYLRGARGRPGRPVRWPPRAGPRGGLRDRGTARPGPVRSSRVPALAHRRPGPGGLRRGGARELAVGGAVARHRGGSARGGPALARPARSRPGPRPAVRGRLTPASWLTCRASWRRGAIT